MSNKAKRTDKIKAKSKNMLNTKSIKNQCKKINIFESKIKEAKSLYSQKLYIGKT